MSESDAEVNGLLEDTQGEANNLEAHLFSKDLEHWRMTDLASVISILRLRPHRIDGYPDGAASLRNQSLRQLLDLLRTSENMKRVVEMLNSFLSADMFKGVSLGLSDSFTTLWQWFQALKLVELERDKLLGIDDIVRYGENEARTRAESHRGEYLLDLEAMYETMATEHPMEPAPGHWTLDRASVRVAGIKFFNKKRPDKIVLHKSNDGFRSTFERVTNGILKGIDWNNVLIAGGMVLAALLHSNPSQDHLIQDHDIDLYIYGLDTDRAFAKADEIVERWKTNLSPEDSVFLVVRNLQTITLLATYPNRRVQIILKLHPTILDVLLKFDLDPCAIGYDGERVVMLPRCARALETGYSCFTMDLIDGHHLSKRRATRVARIIKYADRGFGIRILPSFLAALQDLHAALPASEVGYWGESSKWRILRIAFQARCAIMRLAGLDPDPTTAEPRVHHATAGRVFVVTENRGSRSLEGLMRCAEAWKLSHDHRSPNFRMSGADLVQADQYDYLPNYKWDESFRLEGFAEKVNSANEHMSLQARVALDTFLAEDWMYEDPRYMRCYILGQTLTEVLDHELCLPVIMPRDLEVKLSTLAPTALAFRKLVPMRHAQTMRDAGHRTLEGEILSPNEARIMCWWVVDASNAWTGAQATVDELSDLILSFHHWFRDTGRVTPPHPQLETSDSFDQNSNFLYGKQILFRSFMRHGARRRETDEGDIARMLKGLPSLVEAMRFEEWVSSVEPTLWSEGLENPDLDSRALQHYVEFNRSWMANFL